ncbi:hypothetical protein PENARI_c017G09107 [Penicillium arizonense]|uniref:CCHC-type domain-containing protein n=1 Tax=Penicillium arizonense TaxID=1835702 RepID=A0A1F5LB67_PENAI|nr:hypothetical protein PENARI_c017G09107 [Penicillium arizonense]OGE50240.1 hypothetical protein PENARI_c017G09107 [Penicillium arizonense]
MTRILDANHEVQQLLNFISSGGSIEIPKEILQYLKGIKELTQDLINNPLGQDWQRYFEQIHEENRDLKQDIHVLRASTTANETRSTGGRALSSEIKERAEKARVRAVNAASPVLASIQFVAARQLKSGYLSLALRTARDAETARVYRHGWAKHLWKHLWKDLEVRLPSWGVVIHDVNVKSLGINRPEELKGRQEALSWLVLPEGKKSGSMVVEFASPHYANKSLDANTIWDSSILATGLYDRAARIRQCHRCQQYGHIGRASSANSPKCVYCAGDHLFPDCRGKQDATLIERARTFEAETERVREFETKTGTILSYPGSPLCLGSGSEDSRIQCIEPDTEEIGDLYGISTRSKQASSQGTNPAKSKPIKPAAKKPASTATGGNTTSIATRSNANQPTEASIMRTLDNEQTLDIADGLLMDLDLNVEFDNPANQAGLHRSIHAPRSEPVRTRSRAAASS